MTEQGVCTAQDEGVDNGAELCAALLGKLGILAGRVRLPAPQNGRLKVLAEGGRRPQNHRVAKVDHGIELHATALHVRVADVAGASAASVHEVSPGKEIFAAGQC